MSITQKDIARNLGISLITVNRAFNNSGYVSAKLKRRIFSYAKKYAYVPHRASQILVRNKVQKLTFFSSAFPVHFWDEVKRGVYKAGKYIRPLNYEVHYYCIPEFDNERFVRIVKREIKNGLSAAAFIGSLMYDMKRIVSFVEKAGIPYIFFNVDDPVIDRLCYIGPDYNAGGRLAANYIGKSLSMKALGKVLVIGIIEDVDRITNGPDINLKRLKGFLEVMKTDYPYIVCQVVYLRVKLKQSIDLQIKKLLRQHENRVDAVYFVPAYNDDFLNALEKYDYSRTITVLHDVTEKALNMLEHNLLTALVFQDPLLQGYISVRTLEDILESKTMKQQPDIQISHNLIFKENLSLLKNHYLLSGQDK
jgi:LacI family transcriptional regulator